MADFSSELDWLDAVAAADKLRQGDVPPGALVENAILQIERKNPSLNAVITPMYDFARRSVEAGDPNRPFHGVPLLLKDLTSTVSGEPYFAGTRVLAEHGYRSARDSELVARLRRAGFALLGKTNTPELGTLPTTEPEAFGPTHNPWDLARSPGGSSGGSAAAVAAGLVPVAHASDGGGSIRVPASACGLVGLKPSRGRITLGPELGEGWAGCVSEGVVTRSVRDSAVLLDVLSGSLPGDPYTAPPPNCSYKVAMARVPSPKRIALVTKEPRPGVETHEDCQEAAMAAGRMLESLGHHVEHARPAVFDEKRVHIAFSEIVEACTASELDRIGEIVGRSLVPEDVEALNWAVAERGRELTSVDYIRRLEILHAYSRRLAGFWSKEGEGFDLLVTPTMAEPPPVLGTFRGPPEDPLYGFRRSVSLVAFTSPYNISGQPAISLPLHWNRAGIPIGVQLVAGYGREDLLFAVSRQLEEIAPWSHRYPTGI